MQPYRSAPGVCIGAQVAASKYELQCTEYAWQCIEYALLCIEYATTAEVSMQRSAPVLSSPPADYDTWPEWSREKLDQNIPIDRKGTGTHWQLRSVVLHTFVFVFVFVFVNPNSPPFSNPVAESAKV